MIDSRHDNSLLEDSCPPLEDMLRISPAFFPDKQALRKDLQKKADGRLGGLSRNEFVLTFRQSTMIDHVLYYL